MKTKLALILIFLCFIAATTARAGTVILSSASLGMPELDIGAGARYIALGGAATALPGDASAVEWNPGTLGYMRDMELNLEHKKWFMDATLEHITGTYPMQLGTLAGAVSYVNMGTFEQLDAQGFLTGQSFSPMAILLTAGYGLKIPGFEALSAGMSLRMAYQAAIDSRLFYMGADFGLYYRLNDVFGFGLAMQNAGFLSKDPSPLNVRAGASANVLSMKDVKLTLTADGYFQNLNGGIFSAGAECEAFDLVVFRAGYKVEPDNTSHTYTGSLSAGLGLRLGVFKIDYAFQTFGDMGVNHIVSVGLLYKELPKGMTLKEYESVLIKTYYRDAMTSYKMGDYETAYQSMNRTLSLSPGNASLQKWVDYFWKAADAKKKKDEAAAAAGQAAQKLPVDEAYEQYKANNYKKAAEILAGIPKDTSIMYQRAALLSAEIRDKTDKAAEKMKDAEKFLKAGDVVDGIGDIRAAAVMCPGCEEPFDRLRAVYPQALARANELYLSGISKYTDGDIREAMQDWEKVITLAPSSPAGKKASENINKAKVKLKMLKEMLQ